MIVCTLVGAAVRTYVVRDAPASVEEQILIASGVHLIRHHDTDVTAFHHDMPLAAHATGLPLIGLAVALPERDPAGPAEQVGWTALNMTSVSASGTKKHPPEFVPAETLLRLSRAPSLLALILTLIAVVLLTDGLFGKGAALVAGLVVAIEPMSALRGGLAVTDPFVQAAVAWLLVAAAVHWERMVGTTDRHPGKEKRSAIALGAAFGFTLLASVTAWPLALAVLGWLGMRGAAARRRGEEFRGGRGSRMVWAALVCGAFVAAGYLVVDVRAIPQPLAYAAELWEIGSWKSMPSGTARSMALPVAWLTIFALLGLPFLFRERADYPALLSTAVAAGLLTTVLAPDHLAHTAYAVAVPALAVTVGSSVGLVGTSRSGFTASLGVLLPLAVISGFLVATHEPQRMDDNHHAQWFTKRVVDAVQPRVMHIVGSEWSEKIEVRGSSRTHTHPAATEEQILEWLAGERTIVALSGDVPESLRERVVSRARGLAFLE